MSKTATPAATRIYRVASKPAEGSKPAVRLVRAAHPSAALRHVAAGLFEVNVASQDELETAFVSGVRTEVAGTEPAASA